MSKYTEILELIRLIRESFPDAEKVYTQGGCVRFALILKKVYPQGDIMWNEDHAVFRLEEHYYDITGEVEKSNFENRLVDRGILEIKRLLELSYQKPIKK